MYSQLALLWAFGKLGLGRLEVAVSPGGASPHRRTPGHPSPLLRSLPASLWFFTLAGWMSVLEHDRFERAPSTC